MVWGCYHGQFWKFRVMESYGQPLEAFPGDGRDMFGGAADHKTVAEGKQVKTHGLQLNEEFLRRIRVPRSTRAPLQSLEPEDHLPRALIKKSPTLTKRLNKMTSALLPSHGSFPVPLWRRVVSERLVPSLHTSSIQNKRSPCSSFLEPTCPCPETCRVPILGVRCLSAWTRKCQLCVFPALLSAIPPQQLAAATVGVLPPVTLAGAADQGLSCPFPESRW